MIPNFHILYTCLIFLRPCLPSAFQTLMKPSCYQRTSYGPMPKKGTEWATWDPQECWRLTVRELAPQLNLFSLGPHPSQALPSRQQSPSFLAPGMSFMEDNFPMNQAWGDGLGMIQAHYIDCALYSYYYYISSTFDYQTLDLRGWRPLFSWNQWIH